MTPRPADVVREQGELLAVSHGVRLASVCVKCATRDGVASRLEMMQAQPRWTWLLYLTGVIGVVLLAFLQRTAGVALPLCRACDARWRKVVRRRSRTTLMVVPVSLLVCGALVADAKGRLPSGAGSWLALGLATGWAVLYAAAQLAGGNHLVTAASVDRSFAFLRGVHPDARRALVAEAGAVRRER